MMSLQGSLSIERMCAMVPVCRRGFYRSLKEQRPIEEEMEVRSVIQTIALEHRRRYGYRRITAELRRRGMQVNHKRVARIMREDNLLGVRFSRKVVGWALDRTLANRLTLGALEQAMKKRQPVPGLVHHSDRGLQYACTEYAAILESHGAVASMSRPANPYDNASCESFMKTLKREEIYANKYVDLDHLRANIEEFIEEYYNRQRLHSALGIDLPKSSSNKSRRQIQSKIEAQRWCSLRTKCTTRGVLQGCWGKGLRCRPLPQTPTLARRCKNALTNRELGPINL
jgi:transposase InsO family protein